MRVSIIGKKYIVNDILPRNIVEDYWIVDKNKTPEQRLINIKAQNGAYELISDNNVKIIDFSSLQIEGNTLIVSQKNKKIIPGVILQENTMYPIIFNNSNIVFMLYCLQIFSNQDDPSTPTPNTTFWAYISCFFNFTPKILFFSIIKSVTSVSKSISTLSHKKSWIFL